MIHLGLERRDVGQVAVALGIVQAVADDELVGDVESDVLHRDVHLDQGVQMLLGTGVEAFEGDGKVSAVKTTDGRQIECDYVVVGVGVRPRISLAEAAGLDIGNGILVSELLESSAPGVFAAGDVAGAEHPFFGTRIRVEHWANALNQGPAAARNMLGRGIAYDRIPYFYSDQYDVGMEYSGYAERWDEVVFRGDPGSREFVAFWIADGRVLAGMNVNVWDVNQHVQSLIRSRAVVDRARLADADTPLQELLPQSEEEYSKVDS